MNTRECHRRIASLLALAEWLNKASLVAFVAGSLPMVLIAIMPTSLWPAYLAWYLVLGVAGWALAFIASALSRYFKRRLLALFNETVEFRK